MRKFTRRYRKTNTERALRPWEPWLVFDPVEIDRLLSRSYR